MPAFQLSWTGLSYWAGGLICWSKKLAISRVENSGKLLRDRLTRSPCTSTRGSPSSALGGGRLLESGTLTGVRNESAVLRSPLAEEPGTFKGVAVWDNSIPAD